MNPQRTMKVGLIGLGHMGSGIARSLLRAGHEVTVYNRTPEKVQSLVELGAKPSRSVADACQGDAVISMLSDDRALENVVFAERGVLQSLGKGSVHISMSTISIAMAERLTAAHTGAGQDLISAPVFGRPDVASEGKLFVVAAGKQTVVDRCLPLFEAIGRKTVYIGNAPQSANLVKLSGNFILASVIEALGEAMALIGKAGIDVHRYVNLLTDAFLTGPAFANYAGLIADGKFHPASFSAPLGEKDLQLTLAASESLRVPMPLASLIHDRLLTLVARGGDRLDWSAMGQLAANDAGLGEKIDLRPETRH